MLSRPAKVRIQTSTVVLVLILLFGAWYLGLFDLLRPGSIEEFSAGDAPLNQGVAVNKPLRIAVIDKFQGQPVASATVQIFVDGALRETLTTAADGTASTTLNYRSGESLNILVTKSNSKAWYQITVPFMSEADAQAATHNPIQLEFFTLAAITLQVRDSFGNTYANGGNLNKTTLGSSVVSLTFSWFVSADGTGYLASYDPINSMRWDAVAYVKVSGTGYEAIQIQGVDTYPVGLAKYGASVIDPTELTKYKVGNQYVHPGTGARTITLDLSGYSGDLADLDIFIVVYTDVNYHRQYGSFGPDAIILASFTLNLVD